MKELEIIKSFYGNRTARRSGIPLINHITEGLTILNELGAQAVAKRAWCIHPIVQADEDMRRELADYRLGGADTSAIILAMEYRFVANSYLSFHRENFSIEIVRHMDIISNKLEHFEALRHMLIADKIQNYKDFRANESLYDNAHTLNEYFLDWIFLILKLSQEEYRKYTDLIKEQ